MNKKAYKWFYDNIHNYYYNFMIKWCFFPLGGEENCRNELLSDIKFSEREKILEMCCGTGGATRAIAERAGDKSQIFGIDLSSSQLKVAAKRREFKSVRLIEGDVARTSFPDCSFDKVFIPHALHEMRRDDRLEVLREARRVLKENGSIIVLELDEPKSRLLRIFFGFWFFYWLPFNFETSTRRDMLQHGLEREMSEAGFKNVSKIPKCNGVLQTVQGIK